MPHDYEKNLDEQPHNQLASRERQEIRFHVKRMRQAWHYRRWRNSIIKRTSAWLAASFAVIIAVSQIPEALTKITQFFRGWSGGGH